MALRVTTPHRQSTAELALVQGVDGSGLLLQEKVICMCG
jgi:hypothetical protein